MFSNQVFTVVGSDRYLFHSFKHLASNDNSELSQLPFLKSYRNQAILPTLQLSTFQIKKCLVYLLTTEGEALCLCSPKTVFKHYLSSMLRMPAANTGMPLGEYERCFPGVFPTLDTIHKIITVAIGLFKTLHLCTQISNGFHANSLAITVR